MHLRSLALAVCLALPAAASAAPPPAFRLGVGLGLVAPALAAGNAEDLLGPIEAPLAPALRLPVIAGALHLEPEFLFARDRESATPARSWTRLGLVVAYGFDVGERSRGYVGPAVAWTRRSSTIAVEQVGSSSVHFDDVAVTLAAGGEWLVGEAFGLGIEGRLGALDVDRVVGVKVRQVEADGTRRPVPVTAHDTLAVAEVIAGARVYFR